MLEIGDRFPIEKLPVVLDGPAVVYFYPAALTPGCTMEAKAFNDRYDRWRERCETTFGMAEVIIAKQRHGPTGMVRLSFEGQFTKFGNLPADAEGPGPVFE